MVLVFTLYALFASVFTIGKVSLSYASPLFIVGSRMALAGLILIVVQLIRDRKSFKMPLAGWLSIVLFAILGIYLTNACEFWSLQYLTSAKTCFLYSGTPFISALFSFLILKESMSQKKWWGLVFGFIGLLPIIFESSSIDQVGYFFTFSWPEFVLIAATVASALGWIFLRKSVAHQTISLFVTSGLGMLIGGLVTLGHSYMSESWNPLPIIDMAGYVKTTLALLVVSNLLAYNLYGFLLKRYSATFMAFAGFSTPFFAALFGWFFLNEVISWPLWIGLGVLFVGLTLFYQEEIKTQGFVVKIPQKQEA